MYLTCWPQVAVYVLHLYFMYVFSPISGIMNRFYLVLDSHISFWTGYVSQNFLGKEFTLLTNYLSNINENVFFVSWALWACSSVYLEIESLNFHILILTINVYQITLCRRCLLHSMAVELLHHQFAASKTLQRVFITVLNMY